MKFNKWTLGLAAVGVVSLTSAARADEKPSPIETALSNTTISGYVSTSANVGLTGNDYNSPAASIPFQAGKENGFNLDVVDLTISKPEDNTPWSAGYMAEFWFGPDAVGFNPSLAAGASDISIKQAYLSLNVPFGNGIDVKAGVFDSPLGYEDLNASNDPNYTRSWGRSLEPTELTGLEATYTIIDGIAVGGGVADTSAGGINNRNGNDFNDVDDIDSTWHLAYFGDLTLTAPSSWGALAGSKAFVGVLYGAQNTVANGFTGGFMGGNQINYYGGLTLNTPWKPFTVGASFDYVRNFQGGFEYPGYVADEDVLALGFYASYKATDKLSFNGRFEYVEADDYQNTFGSVNLIEVTGTVEYDLWANVISRLELRWDQNLSYGTGDQTFFPAGTTERADVGLYANLIYKF